MSRSFTANGNIKCSRFVKIDTTADYKVLQSSTGERSIGISEEGTQLPPWNPLDAGYAAVDEGELRVFQEGDECLLCVGAAVTVGDRLKSDSDGRGVTASVSADQYGAIALETATAANQLIRAKVTLVRTVP